MKRGGGGGNSDGAGAASPLQTYTQGTTGGCISTSQLPHKGLSLICSLNIPLKEKGKKASL